ncbi:unnamed protein product [Acanthocheilonema viteae]|uniref:alpha-1,2-Mannosidase n=1 Tax=Acanthocheilonema viteae TaxID=6277 RepID=A0A498S575_ACAVI|nr:unnamed protein product [Acanthocheilonema viteae]
MLDGIWRWSLNQLMYSVFILHIYIGLVACGKAYGNEKIDRIALRLQAKEMFMHGYNSYMKYAYPHDELMPLSCKGRQRGVTPPRGDVDDALGNFSLTLVDSLDTLVVLDELDEFEKSVERIVKNVRFDSNLVVSVFETNIRMVGGLISGHVMAKLVQSKDENRLGWYKDELLQMAAELADKLLPAFNTSSGIPYSRINLKYGMLDFLRQQHDTCTACGGTMILEFAALSRLTGKPIYEEKARKAMDFLWAQRHRGSDLMGTVLNVHSGDWIRRDAGIGAGIDSYYEYCLKAYILLGDERYLYRFNKHYDAIMRYVNKGPLFIDVHMHKPTVAARTYMDSLLAFWPGIQVLKGDLKAAIEFHETLYQRHKFLPEAFTHDLQVHWAQHPIRPEFIESTYLLYRATKDEHYLRVAQNILDSMNKFLRVECGFAAVKDIRSMNHEDRMDSFVLSETLKYLYMIFTDSSDLPIDLDNYVLTTEAHFIPLSVGDTNNSEKLPRRLIIDPDEIIDDENALMTKKFQSACPATVINEKYDSLPAYAEELRNIVQSVVNELTKNSESFSSCSKMPKRLSAWSFSATNVEHMKQLKQMGIQMQFQVDGHVHLTHSPESGEANEFTTESETLAESDNMLNSVCMLDNTASVKKQANIYIVHPSHAAVTQLLSIIMLVILLWLSVMIVAGVVVCVVVCGYRIIAMRRSTVNPVNIEESDASECVVIKDDNDDNDDDDDDGDDDDNAISPEWAVLGSEFIQEMIMMAGSEKYGLGFNDDRIVQVVSQPVFGTLHWRAASAQFGQNLNRKAIIAEVQIAVPFRACGPLTNALRISGRIAIVQRQDCMFQEKARYVQESGAVGIIIIDNTIGTSIDLLPPFAMSGDQTIKDDIVIPAVFLYNKEGLAFMEHIVHYPNSLVRLSDRLSNPSYLFENFARHGRNKYPSNKPNFLEDMDYSEDIIVIDSSLPAVLLNFRFASISTENNTEDKQKVIEENIEEMQKLYNFATESDTVMFYNVIRQIGYWQLGLNMKPTELRSLLMAASDVLAEIERSFHKLQESKDCHSLLKKHLSKVKVNQLKDKKTKLGATLLDVMQSGVANLDSGVLGQLIKGLKAVEQSLPFSRDPRLGWLTSCPTNLGTTIRASVHIRLPKISIKPDFKKICDGLKLQAVKQMHDGVKQLIEMEEKA